MGAEGKPHAGEESVPHRHSCSEAEWSRSIMGDASDVVVQRVSRLLYDVVYNMQKDVTKIVLLAIAGVAVKAVQDVLAKVPPAQLAFGALALLGSTAVALLAGTLPQNCSDDQTACWVVACCATEAPAANAAGALTHASPLGHLLRAVRSQPLALVALLTALVLVDHFDVFVRLGAALGRVTNFAWPHLVRVLSLPGSSAASKAAPVRRKMSPLTQGLIITAASLPVPATVAIWLPLHLAGQRRARERALALERSRKRRPWQVPRESLRALMESGQTSRRGILPGGVYYSGGGGRPTPGRRASEVA